MKKMLFPILVTVLIAFAIMPMAAGTVFAEEEDVYSVTVMPGTGTGTAFTVQSTEILTFDEMLADNSAQGCFFTQGESIFYHPPGNAFTAPEGKEFDCWSVVSNRSVIRGLPNISMPDYTNSTITALWKKSAAPTALFIEESSSDIIYGKEENNFRIEILGELHAQEAEIELYNSSFTCISHDGTIPFTLTAGQSGETVENGCRFTIEPSADTGFHLGGMINITKEAWANAKPGTYIAIVEAELSEGGESCGSREIAFMLVVPDTSEYSLWVGDIPVTSVNAENITGSDPVQASYDADSNTLTLNNYTYEGFGVDNDDVKAAIKARMTDDFTIDLIGDNTVKHVYKETSAGAGIYADNNMTITGDGTLTVSDGDNADNYNSRGIRVGQKLTIGSGATVNASSGKGQNSYGVNVNNLTVQGELNAVGGSAKNSYGAYASNNVTVSKDGALNATGGTATKDSFGVFIYNKSPSMTIEGAMTAKGNTLAIAKAADPNPSINTAAIQYNFTIPEGCAAENYVAFESENYDGSNAEQVAAGGKTSEEAKYVLIGPYTLAAVPAGKTLTYSGEEQTGVDVDEGTGCTLTGTVSAANAGSYQATATLEEGYIWADGTTAAKSIPWKINKAVATVTAPAGKTLTYNGKSQTGVAAGSNYTLTGASATNAGSYTAKASLKTNANYTFKWTDGTTAAKSIPWKINKAVATVTAPTGKTLTYNGKTQTGVAAGSKYTLSGTVKAAKAGNYTAKAALKTNANYTYKWSGGTTAAKIVKWKINKAANTFNIKAGTAAVKYSAVKKKAQVLGVTSVITFTNSGQGTRTFVKLSGNKKITIAGTTGKVTVKKGLKKGTYKVKVKARAAGTANYRASAWKSVTFTVRVK